MVRVGLPRLLAFRDVFFFLLSCTLRLGRAPPMAQRRRLTRSRLDFEEEQPDEPERTNGETDLELSVALPLRWSHRLGSLLRPGSPGRRWAMCEWFCSPVDVPFLQSGSEFAVMVANLNAPEGPLPRARWTVLRRALGRPRRFSAAFLRIERANLLKAREEETMTRVRDNHTSTYARLAYV